jgi:hypothetical protein
MGGNARTRFCNAHRLLTPARNTSPHCNELSQIDFINLRGDLADVVIHQQGD